MKLWTSYHTLGIPFPDALARHVCRTVMETTSGEEVFAFIAAAPRNRGITLNHITRKLKYP